MAFYCPSCIVTHSLAWLHPSSGRCGSCRTALLPWPESSSFVPVRALNRGGGFGQVYLARRKTDAADKADFCIKMPRLEGQSEGQRQFISRASEREAGVMERLPAPHFPTFLEKGAIPCRGADPLPYFVMEYVEGVTLDVHMRGVSLPPEARARYVCRLLLQICDALVAADRAWHDPDSVGRPFAHRDLKPANVLVQGGPDKPVVRLIDFGSSVACWETSTVDGALTYAYAPPDQMGNNAPTSPGDDPGRDDRPRDVWALGVMLFELLSGQHPFISPATGQLDFQSLLDLKRPSPPLPPGPGITDGLVELVAWCLQKDPARRCAHAGLVRDELETLFVRRVPGRYPDLARALAGAGNGDVIEVGPGVFHLAEPLVLDRDVILRGVGDTTLWREGTLLRFPGSKARVEQLVLADHAPGEKPPALKERALVDVTGGEPTLSDLRILAPGSTGVLMWGSNTRPELRNVRVEARGGRASGSPRAPHQPWRNVRSWRAPRTESCWRREPGGDWSDAGFPRAWATDSSSRVGPIRSWRAARPWTGRRMGSACREQGPEDASRIARP